MARKAQPKDPKQRRASGARPPQQRRSPSKRPPSKGSSRPPVALARKGHLPWRQDLPVSPPPAAQVQKLVRHELAFSNRDIDRDVATVIRRLTRAGFEAYLVGGCVRDLLLGKQPKDFDVATSARPEDVRGLFRNARIIGRRFRLVHVHFPGGKMFEVATFRRNPRPGENKSQGKGNNLLIRNDNAFGTVDEDAERRDFTINALFYDHQNGEILDFFDGMRDVKRRAVRTIGDPIVRFREDPVRILRAVKFAGKLDLGIDPEVVDAILATRDDLALAARPRLFEEILRLARGGSARRSFFLAWEFGLLHVLLPELAVILDDVDGDNGAASRVFSLLAELDRRTLERDKPFDDVVLWTVLLLEPLLEAVDGERDRVGAALDFCAPIAERLAVPRRVADSMRRIVGVLPRLFAAKLGRFARTELFTHAVLVAQVSLAASGHQDSLRRLNQALDKANIDLREKPRERRERRSRGPRRSRRRSR